MKNKKNSKHNAEFERRRKKSLLNNQKKSPKGRPSSQTHLTTNTYRQRNFPLNDGLEGKIINNHRYNSHSFFPILPAMAARASQALSEADAIADRNHSPRKTMVSGSAAS